MARRGRRGRFVKTTSRRAPRRRASRMYHRARAGASGFLSGARRRLKTFGRGSPNTILGRPISRMVAPTLALGAELALVTRTLPNGDSWIRRVQVGVATAQVSKNPLDVLGMDAQGNNALSILSYQIEQNAGSALVLAGESLILGWVGRAVGG